MFLRSFFLVGRNALNITNFIKTIDYEKFGGFLSEIFTNQTIYIAAPTSQFSHLYELQKGATSRILFGDSLEKYLKEKYRNCTILYDFYGEIFSLAEQRICTEANYFVPWPKSTWSGMVNLNRLKLQKEEKKVHSFNDVHDIIAAYKKSIS